MRHPTTVAVAIALFACGGSEGPDDFGGGGNRNQNGPLDRAPPAVEITNPADGFAAPREPITVTGLASDDSGLERIEVQVDEGAFELAAGLDNWSYRTASLSDGSHRITARATDVAGKSSEMTISVTVGDNGGVDDEPPTVTVLEPTEGAVIGGGPFTVRGTASDNVAVASVSVGINLSSRVTATGTDTWEAELDATLLDAGTTTILINARDTSGNTSELVTLNVTIDRDIPQAVIEGPVAQVSTRASASFVVSGSNVANYTYALDGGGFGGSIPATSPIELSDLSDGPHRIDVLGLDATGVSQVTPTSFTWTVDATPPIAVISDAPSPNEPTQSTSLTLTVTEADRYRYRLDGGPYGEIVSTAQPLILTGLSEGGHVVEVKGLDALGNEQVEPTEVFWRIDRTPPSRPILIDAPPSLTPETEIRIPIAGADIEAYTFNLNGEPESDLGEQLLISIDNLEVRAHELVVTGYDAAGNAGPSQTVTWEVTTEPVPVLDVRPPPEVMGPDVSYEVSGSGFTDFEYRVVPPTGTPSDWSTASFGALLLTLSDYAAVLPGPWAVEFRAPGGPSTVHQFHVDQTPPTATVLFRPPSPSNRADYAFIVGGDEVIEFVFSVDEGPLSPTDSAGSLVARTGIGPGLHSLDVYGIDFAGNVASVATGFNWTVNLTAPNAVISGLPSSPTPEMSATVTVSGLGVVAYRYRLDGGEIGPPLPVAQTLTVSDLAPGRHSIEAFPEDAAGNVGPAAIGLWTVTP